MCDKEHSLDKCRSTCPTFLQSWSVNVSESLSESECMSPMSHTFQEQVKSRSGKYSQPTHSAFFPRFPPHERLKKKTILERQFAGYTISERQFAGYTHGVISYKSIENNNCYWRKCEYYRLDRPKIENNHHQRLHKWWVDMDQEKSIFNAGARFTAMLRELSIREEVDQQYRQYNLVVLPQSSFSPKERKPVQTFLSSLTLNPPPPPPLQLPNVCFFVFHIIGKPAFRDSKPVGESTIFNTNNRNKRHTVCIKPYRPPMTNALTLLKGTKTDFRQVHASERPLACIFQKSIISWGQRSVVAIASLHRPQKRPFPRSEFSPELQRWISKLTASHL